MLQFANFDGQLCSGGFGVVSKDLKAGNLENDDIYRPGTWQGGSWSTAKK